MLAYVFWHRPADGVAAGEYETLLAAFHDALAASPPAGFRQSCAFRVSGAPWVPGGGSGYEDWYLIEHAAALDPLNQAAVTGPRQRPHDVVAARAGWGAAGLYLLRGGAPAFGELGQARWFSKPPGRAYDSFYHEISQSAGAEPWALWCRQMVLGPTPEFCIHGATSLVSVGSGEVKVGLQLVCRPDSPHYGK
jgi:hypothetical protein